MELPCLQQLLVRTVAVQTHQTNVTIYLLFGHIHQLFQNILICYHIKRHLLTLNLLVRFDKMIEHL